MRGDPAAPPGYFGGACLVAPGKEPCHALLSDCMPLPDLCPAHRRRPGAGGHCRPGAPHSVKISQRSLPQALQVLQRAGLSPKRVYITAGDGSYEEVAL